MSATSTANLPNILMRTYTRDNWFVPFERNETKFLDQTEDFQNDEPLGSARFFRLWFADAQASGSVAEAGDMPATSQPTVQQGSVTAIQYAASIGLSELMLEAGRAGGVLDTDIVAAHVRMATRNLFSDINRGTIGHGTGRLAVVEAATVAIATFVARLPEHIVQLRVGMLIAFFNTDTGGAQQGATVTINALNFSTRTVTISANATLTAGWGVYKCISSTVTCYGIATNGLRAFADNGTLAALIYGLSRATFPKLNATILNANGGTQAYSEALVRQGIQRLFHEVGAKDDHEYQIWTNTGILSEHYNFTTPDRVYPAGIGGKDVPDYSIGYKALPVFMYMGRAIPFMIDGDIPARELTIWTKDLARRHILRKASWFGDDTGVGGSASPILMQQPSAVTQGTYALAKIAGMLWMGNITHLFPDALCRITEIADSELAGDAAVI